MRNVLLLSCALLGLASAGAGQAQQTPGSPPPPSAAAGASSQNTAGLPIPETTLRFGYGGLWSEGDQARWERFRDLRSGVRLSGSSNWETRQWAVRFNAANVSYRDQEYRVAYNKFGKLKLTALWNSVPLNYAYNTATPWRHEGGNVWSLDPATRTAVQNKTAFGIGTTAADYTKTSVYRDLATPFELQSRRDILSIGLKYRMTERMGLNLRVNSTKRGGMQPFGGSFAFSNANEHPVALDDRTNDITAGIEWAKPGAGMVRVEWQGSWYNNRYQSLTWDNPLRATDYSNGKLPPLGPYDPSGYSNGNGPALGRLALPPSNSMNSFSMTGMHKLPARSTVSGQVWVALMRQNAELIPWTTNSVILSPVVLAAFPHLASLPRPTAEADILATNALVSFTSRPSRYVAFDLRYRFNDRDNRTPMFDGSEYVRFDAVPEEIEHGESRYHNITRNTIETGATLTVIPNSSLKVGYVFDDVKRTGRAFRGMRDNTFRVSLDTYGNRYVMLRGIYERTGRSGRGLSVEEIEAGGAQPGLRFYDEAPLDRNKGTVILQLTPIEYFDLGFSVAAGKDKYNGAGQEFGLLDNRNTSYNISLNVYPVAWATLSGDYGYEKFSALQKSRNANPVSGTGAYQSWTDPNRDWSLDNDETVKNLGLFLDLIKALPRTDLRFSYNRSESDNAFVYSGPRIEELSTNVALTPGDSKPCGATSTGPCFEQFPNVTNTWHQVRVAATTMLTRTIGLTAGYSYEKLRIVDFATTNLADGSPRIDPLGAMTMGYGNRPYNGHAFTMQFVYMFGSGPAF